MEMEQDKTGRSKMLRLLLLFLIPGIIIQLTLIPGIMLALGKTNAVIYIKGSKSQKTHEAREV